MPKGLSNACPRACNSDSALALAPCPDPVLWKESIWCETVHGVEDEKFFCILANPALLPWPKKDNWCFSVDLREKTHAMPRGWTIQELDSEGAGTRIQPKVLAYPGRVDTHRIRRAEKLAAAIVLGWRIANARAPAQEEVRVCLDSERERAAFHYHKDPTNILVYVQDREFPFAQVAPFSSQELDDWRGYRALLDARARMTVKDKRCITEGFAGCSKRGRKLPFFLGPSLLMCALVENAWQWQNRQTACCGRQANFWPGMSCPACPPR